MSSMIGRSALPLSVSAYSTRGGTSANVRRSTMPASSSARRRSERVRGLMPASERSSSENRERPSARSRTSSSVHLPQMISAVRQTGQVSSTGTPTLYQVKCCRTGGLRRFAALLRLGEVVHGGAALAVGGQQELEVVGAGREGARVVDGDHAGLDVGEEGLVEGLHAVVAAVGDDLAEPAGLGG